MHKYTLTGKYRRFAVYGESPEEALLNAKTIPQRDEVSEDPADPIIRMPKIEIYRVLGVEDMASWEGDGPAPHRVIAATSEGTRFFDLYPAQTNIKVFRAGLK